MVKPFFSTLLIIMIFGAGYVFSQSVTPTPTPSVARIANVRPLTDKDDTDFSRRTSIENLPPEYRVSSKAMKRTKFTDAEKDSLKNVKKDGVKLLKIFIAPRCAEKLVIDVSDQRCADDFDYIPISYYSFFDGIYGQLYGELRMLDGLMLAGNGRYIQGFLIDLGDEDVALLDKKSARVKKIIDYPVAKTSDEADKQVKDLEKGVEYENEMVSSWKKIVPNHTYLMRIVAYGQPDAPITPYNYDSVLAIKIVKLSDDNMAIALWKKLSEKSAPRLKDK